MASSSIKFGHIQINPNFLFMNRDRVFAMVVHNPIKEGHILVCPKSQKARYRELDTQELFELSLTVQFLTKFLQKKYNTDSATVTIQEGSGAGQTINHLHVHIIPRRPGDFKNNDDIYGLLETFDDDYVNKLSQANMQTQKWAELAAEFKEKLAEAFPSMQDGVKMGHI
ncbi:hypothetical protein FGO68_gene11442 [Halteria grandinella]|uniref:HIT domain-containing protein n=1 Tax=Halteria grandinella TaxID=5974 RepID=A0A8J8T567_HALGN|nr:hypothetical protein FGO68_gene17248 [Halteria grandinella]TNV82815.1 hypothetical protein FGO68_gene11442 [Halteria grandinella]